MGAVRSERPPPHTKQLIGELVVNSAPFQRLLGKKKEGKKFQLNLFFFFQQQHLGRM